MFIDVTNAIYLQGVLKYLLRSIVNEEDESLGLLTQMDRQKVYMYNFEKFCLCCNKPYIYSVY